MPDFGCITKKTVNWIEKPERENLKIMVNDQRDKLIVLLSTLGLIFKIIVNAQT